MGVSNPGYIVYTIYALGKPPQPITRIGVQLVDAVHAYACSEILVMASTTDMGSEGTYLVESNGGQAGALVVRALVEPKGGGVPVNLGWKQLPSKQEYEVATLESVDPEPPTLTTAAAVTNAPTADTTVTDTPIADTTSEMLWQLVEESGEELTICEKERYCSSMQTYLLHRSQALVVLRS